MGRFYRQTGVILLFSLFFCTFAPKVIAQESTPRLPITLQSANQKVPAGTQLTLRFQGNMDARITQPGEPFHASLVEDFTANTSADPHQQQMILPKGSVVRGRVNQVRKPGLFGRGGSLTLDFDHVVLPSGELLPIELNLSTENTHVNKAGALYMDPGLSPKLQKSAQAGGKVFNQIKDAGLQAGKQTAGGFGVLVTAPVSIVGGALAGGTVTTGKAVAAVVGKGESAIIQPGDTMTIDFGGAFNLPSE